MPSPMNKRRRISADDQTPEMKQTPTTRKPANIPPNYMTPTKSSLAKSYPHLLTKSPQRQRTPSPQKPARSIPPRVSVSERLTEVLQVNGGEPSRADITGKGFEIDSGDGEPSMVVEGKVRQVSREEEIEREKGILMRRVRLLRIECENLENQLESSRVSSRKSKETNDIAITNVNGTMYFPFICGGN
jgi:hypothetical protein